MTTITDTQLSYPTLMGYTFRPLRREDLPALHALLLTAVEADGEDSVDALEDLQTQFDDPWSNAETDSVIALAASGEMAAFGRCFLPPKPQGEARCHTWAYLHPAHRTDPLEDAVFGWVVARSWLRLAALPTDPGCIIQFGTVDKLVRNIALAERHGFSAERYFYIMRRDLDSPIPNKPWPPGFALRPFTPADAHALHRAHEEAFSDHWGHEAEAFDEWKQFSLDSNGFRSDLTLLVWTGEEMAAYSVNRVHAEDNARNNANEAWIGQLGTRRAWRKRGLASALLCESMRRFKAAGFDTATLGVDAENPTGALGLYEQLGFVVKKRMVVYSKRVE
ncbi:MAG: GNAT family N-acetyltransferase [Anaerolineales bacterium]